jgi:transcriptional regulator with XRE-family HTH domain
MAVRDWSINQLADFTGGGRGYLSEVLAGKKSPTLRILVRLAEGLDLDVAELLAR